MFCIWVLCVFCTFWCSHKIAIIKNVSLLSKNSKFLPDRTKCLQCLITVHWTDFTHYSKMKILTNLSEINGKLSYLFWECSHVPPDVKCCHGLLSYSWFIQCLFLVSCSGNLTCNLSFKWLSSLNHVACEAHSAKMALDTVEGVELLRRYHFYGEGGLFLHSNWEYALDHPKKSCPPHK